MRCVPRCNENKTAHVSVCEYISSFICLLLLVQRGPKSNKCRLSVFIYNFMERVCACVHWNLFGGWASTEQRHEVFVEIQSKTTQTSCEEMKTRAFFTVYSMSFAFVRCEGQIFHGSSVFAMVSVAFDLVCLTATQGKQIKWITRVALVTLLELS